MISPEQEKWLSHLSDDNHVAILPYDPRTPAMFERIKNMLQYVLGANIEVVHRGATALGISGQGELDIYMPVSEDSFEERVLITSRLFGEPKSLYSKERARYVADVDGTKAEIFVINQESKGWVDSNIFENYLKAHPEALEEYEILKEQGAGLSTRAYYRQKIEFINKILILAK